MRFLFIFTHLKFSLTWPLKSYLIMRKVVFQPSFFRGYVELRECIVVFLHFCLCQDFGDGAMDDLFSDYWIV